MKALGTALALVVVLGSASSFAQGESGVREPGGLFDTSSGNRPQMISGYLMVPYYYGFGLGIGARYTLPIFDRGWIDQLNDSVELEFGADAWYDSYGYIGGGYSFFSLAP